MFMLGEVAGFVVFIAAALWFCRDKGGPDA
jgi:hypothetical protein